MCGVHKGVSGVAVPHITTTRSGQRSTRYSSSTARILSRLSSPFDSCTPVCQHSTRLLDSRVKLTAHTHTHTAECRSDLPPVAPSGGRRRPVDGRRNRKRQAATAAPGAVGSCVGIAQQRASTEQPLPSQHHMPPRTCHRLVSRELLSDLRDP